MSDIPILYSPGLSGKWLKYIAIAKISYFSATAYVLNLLAGSLIILIRAWIYTQLYTVAYTSYSLEQVGGLTVVMVVWSLTLTQSFQTSARPYASVLIEEEVKSGTLAYSINRPYSYILFHYFQFMGRVVANLGTNLILGFIFTLILIGNISFTWQGVLFGTITLFFGYIIEFLFSMIIGLMAFWIEDVSAIRWIYSKGQLVFGGLLVPLSLLPEKVRNIAEWLPFSQMYYVPARLLVNFDYSLLHKFLITQAVWVVILGVATYWTYKKGQKYVSINGG